MVHQVIYADVKAVERSKKPYDTQVEITFGDGSTLRFFDPDRVIKVEETS